MNRVIWREVGNKCVVIGRTHAKKINQHHLWLDQDAPGREEWKLERSSAIDWTSRWVANAAIAITTSTSSLDQMVVEKRSYWRFS